MDAFIVLLLVIVIICWSCYKRKMSAAAYGIAALDIFLRIINFIALNLKIKAISDFFAPWPNSLLAVVSKYMSGFIYMIIAWAFVLLMIYFLILTVISFVRK